MGKKDELIKIFAINIREIFEKAKINFECLQEVRLRINSPLIIVYNFREYFISRDGRLLNDINNSYTVDKKEIKETMEYISNYSLYAYEDEIKQGFITIMGGHRVGIAGKTVIEDNNVTAIKYISYINVRVSHEIKGCADKIIKYIASENTVHHSLIISPPRGGKTTLLRDIVRQISNGSNMRTGKNVGVVDERSEIGGCYMGEAKNDLGIRTDILDCCPKAKGMLMLIRSMSPSVIAVDEIGSIEDANAIETVMNCGCKILATVHGASIEDIKSKPVFEKMLKEKVFERYIVLNANKCGAVKEIYDERGSVIYRE